MLTARHSVVASLGVSAIERTDIHIVEPGVKVDAECSTG